MLAEALELQDIAAGYNGTRILTGLSLTVGQGEFLGILGPNGSGKTTLLRVVCGLLPAWEGEVRLQGQALAVLSRRQLARQVAFLPQLAVTDIDLSVCEMVALGRWPHLGRLGRLSKQDADQIRQSLRAVDLEAVAERSMLSLSGGEKQRVLLARALAQEPRLLLLDEPTSHLDLAHQVEFFELLKGLHRAGRMTIVCVSHDVNLCANYVERIALIRKGQLFALGAVEDIVQQEVLEAVFGTPVQLGKHPQTGRPQVFLQTRAE